MKFPIVWHTSQLGVYISICWHRILNYLKLFIRYHVFCADFIGSSRCIWLAFHGMNVLYIEYTASALGQKWPEWNCQINQIYYKLRIRQDAVASFFSQKLCGFHLKLVRCYRLKCLRHCWIIELRAQHSLFYAIWRHKTGTTLAQVMAWCLTAPSHYMNKCWLIIGKALCYSSEDIIIRSKDTNQ